MAPELPVDPVTTAVTEGSNFALSTGEWIIVGAAIVLLFILAWNMNRLFRRTWKLLDRIERIERHIGLQRPPQK